MELVLLVLFVLPSRYYTILPVVGDKFDFGSEPILLAGTCMRTRIGSLFRTRTRTRRGIAWSNRPIAS